ncbi:EAL domain-containing protein [Rubrimonas cliftonensis]|uniref:Diguanylate cyclase/phosphodiesterase n=1 Tax=Rubrimonas cliftonensis TaxID=89524 RepID=A0A1H4F759_9RHOB|nr:GGDEF domain-containing phosphodiesterase [Rubrimonas cliftonensis]SEA93123.1 diguanylate cyclase/phosphodiesterase [Rubrimonas cliftonensis]
MAAALGFGRRSFGDDADTTPPVSAVPDAAHAPAPPEPAECGRAGLRRSLEALAATLPPETPVALMIFGVDGMREFSRGYGFDAGDALARAVGRRLRESLPDGAGLARVGSFSFAAALIDFAESDTAVSARMIADDVASRAFDIGFGPITATVSIGVRSTTATHMAGAEAFDSAFAALDDARAGDDETGRSEGRGVCIVGSSARRDRASPAEMRGGARSVMQALTNNDIGVAFQPVVSAKPPHGLAFRECLARLRHDGQWSAAGQFIHKIERLDLVSTLDRRILRVALETLRAHPTERLSVNVSARTTADRHWLRDLREAAERDPSSAERLIVELTESAAVSDPERTIRFLDGVRSHGCAIALDDFGAGYSSFRHMRDFRPDWVKIDGGFVRGIAGSPDNMLFVDTLVGIARNFDMATVAEFVETDADAETLLALGVDCLQGYRFGAPAMAPAWKDAGPAAAAL